MTGYAPHQRDPAAAVGGLGGPPMDPKDVECPICYQEYNQHDKCPRMLECLHVFCTECLQRIQLCPCEPPDPPRPPAIPCPLCRHLTPLENGDALTLPCNSRWASVAFPLPVFSVEGESRDARFIILPTVSLRVQQRHPDHSYGAAPGLLGEDDVIQQSRKTLFCVQLMAVIFWVLFVITCVVGVVFGPHILNKKLT